jgi:type IV pilus assembly protein PilE
MGKQNKGFSLLELLTVVAIISIVASLAIPSLVESRKAAHESTAISFMRSLVDAQELYRLRNPQYAADIPTLVADNLVPDPNPSTFGYTFAVGAADANYWAVSSAPVDPGVTGDRYFFVDSTGVLRASEGGPAGAGSAPLGSGT